MGRADGGFSPAKQAEFTRIFAGDVPAKLAAAVRAVKKAASTEAPKIATRSASEKVLAGGEPDLAGNHRRVCRSDRIEQHQNRRSGRVHAENRKGRYVYYGIREHGMASAMNGMALHGGVRPYSGTFMCFTDYARPRCGCRR